MTSTDGHCPVTGKRQYLEEGMARATIGYLLTRGTRNATELRTYVCPHCRQYHLTHQPQQHERKWAALERAKPEGSKA